MNWKRTEIKVWKFNIPASPFFQKHFDGEVTTLYFGRFAISFEHWYEKSAEHPLHSDGATYCPECGMGIVGFLGKCEMCGYNPPRR